MNCLKMVVEEKFITLDGHEIYYCVIGNGPHVVLFMQDTLYHSRKTFRHQIENFDHDKYTIVVWDPPGYGKSSPERMLTPGFHFHHAQFSFKLMKALNFEFYTICGVCAGGASSMILAAKHPEVVRSLVLVNTRSHLTSRDMEIFVKYEKLTNCSPEYVQSQYDLYGKERAASKWQNVIANYKVIWNFADGNICSHLLGDIRCPTLIVAGDRDGLIDRSHASFLHKHIKGSFLYVDPEGRHCYHEQKPEEFNRKVQEFLSKEQYIVKSRI